MPGRAARWRGAGVRKPPRWSPCWLIPAGAGTRSWWVSMSGRSTGASTGRWRRCSSITACSCGCLTYPEHILQKGGQKGTGCSRRMPGRRRCRAMLKDGAWPAERPRPRSRILAARAGPIRLLSTAPTEGWLSDLRVVVLVTICASRRPGSATPTGAGRRTGDQVAACLIAVLRRAEGDGHVDAHGEAIGEFSRLRNSSRGPPAVTARRTSLTVAFWACAVCVAWSRLAGMRARLRSEPTVCTRLPGPASRWDERLYEHGSIGETVTMYRLRRSCVVHLRRDRHDVEP